MLKRLAPVALLTVVAALGVSGTAASSSSQATKAQAVAAGWDCSPNITILGYFHCAAPGSPSLLDLITGAATPPTLHLNVYNGETELLAGTEQLIRADLFRGQPCPQEGGGWGPLNFYGSSDPEYYGCHHFAA
jgi:hypothetical protein